MEFDAATAALLAVAGLLMLGLLMQLVGHNGDRPSRLAFQLWNLALVLQGLGLGVLALRGQMPEVLAVVIGNAALGAPAKARYQHGASPCRGKPRPRS